MPLAASEIWRAQRDRVTLRPWAYSLCAVPSFAQPERQNRERELVLSRPMQPARFEMLKLKPHQWWAVTGGREPLRVTLKGFS